MLDFGVIRYLRRRRNADARAFRVGLLPLIALNSLSSHDAREDRKKRGAAGHFADVLHLGRPRTAPRASVWLVIPRREGALYSSIP